jgi:dihydrolipoamide dehydrogenase
MSDKIEVRIPDLGEAAEVEVVEVLVGVGDEVAVDDGLVTLESDKATMDVPAPAAGKVNEIALSVGDQAAAGDLVAVLSAVAESPAPDQQEKTVTVSDSAVSEQETVTVSVSPGDEQAASGDEAANSESVTDSTESVESVSAKSETVTDFRAQIVVLGAGPGGYTAAFRAADLGKRVVLIDRDAALGGVCLNVGCIPSKALLHVAKVLEETKDLEAHGVAFGKPKIDLDKLRGWKDSVVGRLTGGLATMAKKRGVEVLCGEARFASPHSLAVETDDGTVTVGFEQAIVAAGSRVVRLPGIPWDDPRVIDSTGALELADVPKRLLLVGGGIIGLEMAMIYGALGSRITVVELLDSLVPGCDRDLVRPLERRLKKRLGAAIHLKTKVTRIEPQKRGLKVFMEGPKAPEWEVFDRVLVAVGRRPNGDRIGAEAAGLEIDERGFLPVDRQQRTNVPHIFAIGDIVGQPMLAHKATHEGKVAAEVASGLKSGFDARVIPSVAYTDPEIAWVGLTETEAKEMGVAYEIGSFPWGASGRALGIGRDEGKTRVLFDPETHRVLGGGIVGPGAGDLIAELALAIEMDCEAGDLALTVHPHPTLSETVALAAEAYEGTITDLYLPKKRR